MLSVAPAVVKPSPGDLVVPGLQMPTLDQAARPRNVPTVTNSKTLSSGTCYGGMTYNNTIALVHRLGPRTGARPDFTNEVDYILDSHSGTSRYRGLLDADGVVAAVYQKPSRAMTVAQFP